MNIEDQVIALLEPFFLLGLNHNVADYARIARYTVASGLSALYNRIMSDTYTSFASACAEQELFPYSRLDPMAAPNPTHSLQACIDAICSSRTSNPDLGGIGVGSFQFSTRYPYTILWHYPGLHIIASANKYRPHCLSYFGWTRILVIK